MYVKYYSLITLKYYQKQIQLISKQQSVFVHIIHNLHVIDHALEYFGILKYNSQSFLLTRLSA